MEVTMGDPMKDAWSEVADSFAKLGGAMKGRYHTEEEDAAGEGAAPGGPDKLREAFERLVEAGRDVGQRSIDVLRDADVNAQAKQAAVSLNDALSATVDMIGNEVGRWFGRGSDPTATVGDDHQSAVPAEARDAEADAAAAMIDQQLEDAADGGPEDATPGTPGAPPPAGA
jgi:hypothetical protein